LRRLPVFAFLLREYKRYSPLFSFRIKILLHRASASASAAAPSRTARFLSCIAARRRAPFTRRRLRLPGKGAVRSCTAAFLLESFGCGARTTGGWFATRMTLALFVIASCLLTGAGRGLSAAWRREFHTGAACFGKANCDRLLGGRCAMFTFADVMHLLPHEFAGLRTGRFPSSCVFASPFQRFFLRHIATSSSQVITAHPCVGSTVFCMVFSFLL
jgi:hypothetical protein